MKTALEQALKDLEIALDDIQTLRDAIESASHYLCMESPTNALIVLRRAIRILDGEAT